MKTPNQSFFNKLQASIEDIIDDEQLSVGRVSHPFTVPQGYFDELKSNILSSIDRKQVKGNVIPFPKFKIWYAAAALLFFLTAGFWVLSTNDSSNNVSLQNLSQDEIVAYLESEPIGFAEITNSVEFTSDEISTLNAESLFLGEDFDYTLESPELLFEEIELLDEK